MIQRLSQVGDIRFVQEELDPACLAPGSAVSKVDDLTVVLEVGDCLDTVKEIKKVEDKIAKNQRDQVKVKKGAKGSFKYRKNPEVIEARLVELETEFEALQEQLAVLKELQQQHQQPS